MVARNGAGGAGGAGGELGSRHRNGVAAFLATHGLLGVPVAARDGATPTRIHLESDGAVDDIVVEMEDGSRWFIQSKRSAGGNAALRSTMRQWVGQSTRPSDRLVLASRKFSGILNGLQTSIDQVVRDRGVPLGKGARQNVDSFTGLLKEAGSADPRALLSQVILLECSVESPGDPHQAYAIALLSDAVVDRGAAPGAFEVLRGYMQHTASRREWSDVPDWVAAISDGGHRVYADRKGAPGARSEAGRLARSAYRGVLARRLDLLDLSAVKPDLRPVQVSDLLSQWKVSWPSEPGLARSESTADLLDVVRRNPRFVISGQPGMGKSEALRQIAATLAADDTAPLPIFIDLREIVGSVQIAEDVTLELLLGQASRAVADFAPKSMAEALRESVRRGEVVLIVDGLDETRRQRGSVARGLAMVLEQLPVDAGFVLSTRPSALDALTQLDIPVVQLQPPGRLQASLKAILVAMSEQKPEGAARDLWLADRVRALESSSSESEEIWKIPLLASLATLRIGRDRDPAADPTELLSDVISDSVAAWEAAKANHRDGLDPSMRTEMLMDGFIAVGRLINESAAVPVDAAKRAVRTSLGPWALPKPLASVLADQILHFWDERVGVFVEKGGQITARSRQFAEIADVTWLASQPEDAQRSWLRGALGDTDRVATVRLATSRNFKVRDELVICATRGADSQRRIRAVSWLAEMWNQWADAGPDSLKSVINTLADASEDLVSAPDGGRGIVQAIKRSQSRRDGDGWHCVVSLARAELFDQLRQLRDDRIARLNLSPVRRELVDLMVSLRDAAREERALTPTERAGIESILHGSFPKPTTTSRDKDGVFSFDRPERFITGVDDVVGLAVAHVDEFDPSAVPAFYKIARDLSMATYSQVENALGARGYSNPEPLFQLPSFLGTAQEIYGDFHGLGWAFRQLDRMHPSGAAPSRESLVERWRNSELANFLAMIEWADTGIADLRDVSGQDSTTLAGWFSGVIASCALDGHLIGDQARRVLAIGGKPNRILDAVTTPSLGRSLEKSQLDCAQSAEVALGFFSGSTWIAEQAFDLVLNAGCQAVADTIGRFEGRRTWRVRFLATIAALANSEDPSERLADALRGDSAERSGAAAILSQLEGEHRAEAKSLAQDPDGTVRHWAKARIDGATEWTCTRCYKRRPITELPCIDCHQGPVWSGQSDN